jgi:hypothetical protein
MPPLNMHNVTFKWVGDEAVFYDVNGDEIFTINGTTRQITLPAGSGIAGAGGTVVVVDPDDVNIEVSGGGELQIVPASLGTTELDTAVNLLLTAISDLPAADPADGVNVWNDAGTLKVASNALVAALVAGGLGANVVVDHGDASPVTILAADPAKDRACLVIAICTQDVAGGGSKPTFDWGWAADPDALLDQLVVANATVGDVFIGAGVMVSTKELICTIVNGAPNGGPAVGGAFTTIVLALPTT